MILTLVKVKVTIVTLGKVVVYSQMGLGLFSCFHLYEGQIFNFIIFSRIFSACDLTFYMSVVSQCRHTVAVSSILIVRFRNFVIGACYVL
jgi:hypothetical protein